MAITLTITSYQSQVLGADRCKTFTESGGSIGRAPDNDWALRDPERFISSHHARIFFRNGHYYLADLSTNGVFVNGSGNPVGKGNSIQLNEGDLLSFGDYEIRVGAAAASIPHSSSGAIWPEAGSVPDHVVAGLPGQLSDAGLSDTLDPLHFTPKPANAGLPEEGVSPFPAAEPDNVSPMMESFQPPGVSREAIPDNWDRTGISLEESNDVGLASGSQPQVPFPGDMQRADASPLSAPDSPPPYPEAGGSPAVGVRGNVSTAPSASNEDLFAAFMRGAGLDPGVVNPTDPVVAMQQYGALFHEIVQGMMDVLMARANLKNEFRMPLTMIQPVENNPLKFAPGADEALKILFTNQGGGYLSPTEAIHEGFDDIKNHQMAMVAGMQAAFRSMLKRIEPQRFHGQEKGGVRAGLISVGRKSRFWDNYCGFYDTVTEDAERSFQVLFGEEFARAYEEQIQRLSTMRRR